MVLNKVTTQSSGSGISVTTLGDGSPVNFTAVLPRMTSLLTPLFDKLIEVYKPYYVHEHEHDLPVETEEKISFNCLNVMVEDIRELASYLSIIENAIDEIDAQQPSSKDKFLWAIHQRYKDVKKKVLIENNIDALDKNAVYSCISSNADKIFMDVTNSLFDSVNLTTPCEVETLKAAEWLVSCYGFINCKILERPYDYS